VTSTERVIDETGTGEGATDGALGVLAIAEMPVGTRFHDPEREPSPDAIKTVTKRNIDCTGEELSHGRGYVEISASGITGGSGHTVLVGLHSTDAYKEYSVLEYTGDNEPVPHAYAYKTRGVGVVNDFRALLEAGDISKLSKRLYEHLTIHAGFIAHTNHQGFKAYYRGRLTELIRGEGKSLIKHDPRTPRHTAYLGTDRGAIAAAKRARNDERDAMIAASGPGRCYPYNTRDIIHVDRAPWEDESLAQTGYADGLSAQQVTARVSAVAHELWQKVSEREEAEEREKDILLALSLAERHGYDLTPKQGQAGADAIVLGEVG
jgi:hypothetical protein